MIFFSLQNNITLITWDVIEIDEHVYCSFILLPTYLCIASDLANGRITFDIKFEESKETFEITWKMILLTVVFNDSKIY